MDASFDILLSSAGRRVALLQCFKRALAALGVEGRVVAADMSPLSAAAHKADASFLVPPCTTDAFVPHMLELCRREGIRLIIPTIDTELMAYAKNRAAFADIGTTVAVSTPETMVIGGDKTATHTWLVERGFPTVQQAKVDEVLARSSTWRFPLIAKPRFGSASIGVTRIADLAALSAVARQGEMVVQSMAQGQEHTVDVLVNGRGHAVCVVPRRRLEVRAGEVSKAVTVRHVALQDLARRIAEALPGSYGVLNIQIFADDTTHDLRVVEINPRFGGGFPLACEAGADYPRWLIEELLRLPSSASADAWHAGVVMLRYDDAVFVDANKVGL